MSGNQFRGDVSNGRRFNVNGKVVHIVADAAGNYAPSLQSGRYSLKRVLSAEGRELLIHGNQALTLRVSKGKNTRFDVMVQKTQ